MLRADYLDFFLRDGALFGALVAVLVGGSIGLLCRYVLMPRLSERGKKLCVGVIVALLAVAALAAAGAVGIA